MHLSELVSGLCYDLKGDGDVNIECLACDTSAVRRGAMFFCLKGGSCDGHDFFRKAVGDGAVALVCERPLDTKVTQLIVKDCRAFMASVAKKFYHDAADKLHIVAVCGTNGKTSTTYLLDSVFNAAGYKTAVIGTNGVFVGGQKYDSKLTTPDPIDLNRRLYQMYLNKVQFVFLEVSAHAIFYKKLHGITADLAIFTNFSQDHLDFFGDMERYAAVKKSYFCKQYTNVAAVNYDDLLGRSIISETDVPTISYGISGGDVCAENVETGRDGLKFTVSVGGEKAVISSKLCGKFNVYNCLAAIAASRIFGISLDKAAVGIAAVERIDGRNETIFRKDGVRIVVDFAHTPDGITNVLSYLKETSLGGSLIVVFGCGGNRDKFKRPLMARAVAQFADFAVLTNDNPRFEDPQSIAGDAEAGLSCEHKIVLNRSQATEFALSIAKCGDTVAILGKGAEKYQEIKGRKYPYSDVDVVRRLLYGYNK